MDKWTMRVLGIGLGLGIPGTLCYLVIEQSEHSAEALTALVGFAGLVLGFFFRAVAKS